MAEGTGVAFFRYGFLAAHAFAISVIAARASSRFSNFFPVSSAATQDRRNLRAGVSVVCTCRARSSMTARCTDFRLTSGWIICIT